MKNRLLNPIFLALILMSLVSCDSETERLTIDGIWTSFESADNDTPRITLAFQDTNMLWLSATNEMKQLSYKIVGDSIYFFDQLDGIWQPSIYSPGRIQRINDSIIWLHSTPFEVEILERSDEKIDKKEFETTTKSELRKRSVPWYRKE